MTIRVFVQNEAGSTQKNVHDEKTLTYVGTGLVSHAYPFPYGFVVGTDAGDGCNVDCYVITDRVLRTGQVLDCEPIGLMEQFEDGIDDHNVLARPAGENATITAIVEAKLTEHVLECFRHVDGKQMRVGRFLGADDAEAHIAAHLPGSGRVDVSRLAWAGPLTLLTCVLAVLAVRGVAVLTLKPAPQFTPLGWAVPAIDTAVLVVFAILVFGAISSTATNPIRTFQRVALVVLVLSLLPPLATTQASEWGGNWPNAIALMLMHVTAWAVCVTMLPKLTTVPPSSANEDPPTASSQMG
jgi:inorganic pyrophosphatase